MARLFVLVVALGAALAAGGNLGQWLPIPWFVTCALCVFGTGFLLGWVAWLMPGPVSMRGLFLLDAAGIVGGLIAWRVAIGYRAIEDARASGELPAGDTGVDGLLLGAAALVAGFCVVFALYFSGLQLAAWLRVRRAPG